ncbi:MAG TPA: pyruvate, phosphate dikinase, partial [Desulfobacteraceae bacterium]|nr:pyruvate, phosphate dikinase [Desulfobacteraceae bacterium]
VAFTRDPSTGTNKFYGEFLINAQGEDVVAGIRTPQPVSEMAKWKTPDNKTLGKTIHKQLLGVKKTLENHYKDMQDIEFTIQEGKLYMLQCRVGKRTATAALNMAMDMLDEGMIDEKTMVCRLDPKILDDLLHPIVDPAEEQAAVHVAEGLPAGPGGAWGQIVFTAEDAVRWAKSDKKVILVREETNPEDIEGMRAAAAILTARGGMTSHAALVARGWGKCCIVGAGALKINLNTRELRVGTRVFKEGDFFTLNGTKGIVYDGRLKMKDASENPKFQKFMAIADKYRTMKVRTNADTPEDAKTALDFGAQGIGLFRTEHMFYGSDSDRPLFLLRKMILSKTVEERRTALDELFPFVKKEISATLSVMDNLPVTMRLLDPPLHEFVPQALENQQEIADALRIDLEEVEKRSELLKESNPMIGHRGVRLGITYPEIIRMQVTAIFEASAELIQAGKNPLPEIMVPVTCNEKELAFTRDIVTACYGAALKKYEMESLPYLYGTMIEIPRAALIADKMADYAQFFSFGTN